MIISFMDIVFTNFSPLHLLRVWMSWFSTRRCWIFGRKNCFTNGGQNAFMSRSGGRLMARWMDTITKTCVDVNDNYTRSTWSMSTRRWGGGTAGEFNDAWFNITLDNLIYWYALMSKVQFYSIYYYLMIIIWLIINVFRLTVTIQLYQHSLGTLLEGCLSWLSSSALGCRHPVYKSRSWPWYACVMHGFIRFSHCYFVFSLVYCVLL